MKNLTFQNKPVPATQDDLILNGNVVGWVKACERPEEPPRYHAGFHLKTSVTGGLIQGFGATKEAAILAAIADGKADTQRLLAAIEALEIAIGVDA